MDLSFGSCPSKFSTAITVEVAYGTSSSATAKWAALDSKASGSTGLAKTSSNTFQGKLSGVPTKTPVMLTIEVTGPDGSTTNDPFEITHTC